MVKNRVKLYDVTLTIQIDDSQDSPDKWDWTALLDLAGHEYARVDDCVHVCTTTVDDEGEPIKA